MAKKCVWILFDSMNTYNIECVRGVFESHIDAINEKRRLEE